MIVVDASVALKWFFDEQDSELARALLIEHAGQMLMPELFEVEVLNGFVRQANMDAETPEKMRIYADAFLASGRGKAFDVRSMTPLVSRAADLALQLRHPVKDCIYLALAESLEARLVTADLRFVAKAREVYPAVVPLADLVH